MKQPLNIAQRYGKLMSKKCFPGLRGTARCETPRRVSSNVVFNLLQSRNRPLAAAVIAQHNAGFHNPSETP